jgi:hypothetical protein
MEVFTVQRLVRRVGQRTSLVFLASRLHRWFLASAGVYLTLLCASRLLGLFSPWLTPGTLLTVPAIALAGALLFHRRPTRDEAARLIDERMATKDLFLTAVLIDHAAGEYKPLVLADAEQRAATIQPGQVVHYQWQRRTAGAVAAAACLVAAVLWLPRFDPFGREAKRLHLLQQQERLASTRHATELRVAALQQKPKADASARIDQAIADLQKTFKEMKPADKQANLARLNDQQQQLGQLWKQMNDEKLRNLLAQAPVHQGFGATDPAKLQQWKDDLQKGDVSSVKKELDELKELTRQLAAASDPAARDKLRQEIASRLQALNDALGQQLTSQALHAALQRALEQLDLSKLGSLSADALKGVSESLQLTDQELQQLALAAQNMQQLEDALKTLQLARRLNDLQPLDGMQGGSCKNLGDYAALYGSLYKSACQGGNGLGPGQGVGKRPYGDESQTTAYKPDQSSAPLQPGKILLQWTTPDVSTPGKAQEDFQRALDEVKQQASEAVVSEQIPAGYHQTIQHYFDSLGENPTPPAKP